MRMKWLCLSARALACICVLVGNVLTDMCASWCARNVTLKRFIEVSVDRKIEG